MKPPTTQALPLERRIWIIRGKRVMLDIDLAGRSLSNVAFKVANRNLEERAKYQVFTVRFHGTRGRHVGERAERVESRDPSDDKKIGFNP